MRLSFNHCFAASLEGYAMHRRFNAHPAHRDGATISPMLAAAPAAQQILLSTPAGAGGEFHRAWSSGEDWERDVTDYR